MAKIRLNLSEVDDLITDLRRARNQARKKGGVYSVWRDARPTGNGDGAFIIEVKAKASELFATCW